MTIEERYLLIAPATLALYQLFKPIALLKRQHRIVQFVAAPYIALFVTLDVLYNLTFGTILFWELPRELMFTDRLKRVKQGDDMPSWSIAFRLCQMLNQHDPDHC